MSQYQLVNMYGEIQAILALHDRFCPLLTLTLSLTKFAHTTWQTQMQLKLENRWANGERAAAQYCGVSVRTWRRAWTSGLAPKPIRASARRLLWLLAELDRYLASRRVV